MQNTGTVYSSTERTPTVLPELAELLPPLSGEQFAALEADILKNGCYSPVIVNEDLVIVDGHNRQKLCEQHDIPYNIAVFSFESLLEAKQWALDTQKGRRNLDKWELGKIALRLKPDLEAVMKGPHVKWQRLQKSGLVVVQSAKSQRFPLAAYAGSPKEQIPALATLLYVDWLPTG